jgi:hypothetical protein
MFIFLMFFLFACISVSSTTFYLSSSLGNDTHAGTSPLEPWQTFSHTASIINSGYVTNSTLLLLSGDVFTLSTAAFFQNLDNFTLSSYSTSDMNISLLRRPVLFRPSTFAAGPTLTFDEATNINVIGIEIKGGEVGIAFTYGAASIYDGNIQISNCYFENIRGLNYNASSGSWWGSAIALAAGKWPILIKNIIITDMFYISLIINNNIHC